MPNLILTQQDLPYPAALKIVRGDDFLGQLFRHKLADGSYIDTTTWTVTGAIYRDNVQDAPVIQEFTMVDGASPEFGYQATLTKAETLALNTGQYWYQIQTFDGTTARTYFAGKVIVIGV